MGRTLASRRRRASASEIVDVNGRMSELRESQDFRIAELQKGRVEGTFLQSCNPAILQFEYHRAACCTRCPSSGSSRRSIARRTAASDPGSDTTILPAA